MKKVKTEIKYLCNQCWLLVNKPKRHYIMVGNGEYTTVQSVFDSRIFTTTEGTKKHYTGKIYCPKCKGIGSFKKAIVPKGKRKGINKLLYKTADLSGFKFRSANLEEKYAILENNNVKFVDGFINTV